MSVSPAVAERRTDAIRSARSSCAWIDRTGCSVVIARGADRVDLLHRLSTNDLTGLADGHGKATVLLTEKARIIDVLIVLQHADHAMILGSVGTAPAVVSWLKKYVIMDDVRLKDETASWEAIEICGPRAAGVVDELTNVDVSTLPLHHWRTVPGSDQVLIVRMPSVAELSYWIIGPHSGLDEIRTLLVNSEQNIPHLNDRESEYLRVAGGMGAIGREWSDAYNPLEAGLLHLTSFTKGCYIGQEVVARLDSYNKVKQRIMGLKGAEPFALGDDLSVDGVVIGRVTSVVPALDDVHTIGLGYVRGEHANVGAKLTVLHDGSEATVVQSLLPMED